MEGMDIKSITQLYTETHTVSHVRTRLQGDTTVNAALDCTLNREGSWTIKKSIAVENKATFLTAMSKHSVNGESPEFTGETATKLQHEFNKKVPSSAKAHMAMQHEERCEVKLKAVAVQGKNLELAAAAKTDFIWKSYLYNMKAGTMKFLLNATIDTLPTAANLHRWKKSPSDKCKLCLGRQTTDHCLNICKMGLDTGRWTWRHNNILHYIMDSLDKSKYTVHSDLPGQEAAGGGTIPPEICVTPLKPDIVILNKHKKEMHIFELTCPLERNIEERHLYKQNKYAHFSTDITSFKTSITAFEVSSRGFISKRNQSHLHSLQKLCTPGIKLSTSMKNISTLSIYSSYHLWLCRSDPIFVKPPFLQPTFHDK